MRIKTVLLTSTAFLKISAACLAFLMWSMLSDLYVMSATYTVPLLLKPPSNMVTDKPERVEVTLRGLRKYMRALDIKHLAVIVDGSHLAQGSNRVTVTPAMLGLPNVISVVDYNPINLTIVADQRQALDTLVHENSEEQVASDVSQQRI